MKTIYDPAVKAYLAEVHDYITEHSAARYADSEIDRIIAAIKTIARFPNSGRPIYRSQARQLIVKPYVVTYSATKTELHILDIRHGAQRQYSPVTGKPVRRLT